MFLSLLCIVGWISAAAAAGDIANENVSNKDEVCNETASNEDESSLQFATPTEPFLLSDLMACNDGSRGGSTCENPNIAFQKEWIAGWDSIVPELHRLDTSRLPEHLPPPDFVRVYKVDDKATDNNKDSTVSISQLALAVRNIVDSELPSHPAILFRGLEKQVSSAAKLREFGDAVHGNGTAWKPSEYMPIYANRKKVEGLFLVNHVYPQYSAIITHNENAFVPNPPSRFALYCLHPASEGGETLIVKNEDLTRSVRREAMDMVREAGGIYISKIYYDRNFGRRRERGLFWQDVCRTENREECIVWFTENGHNAEDISFDEEGTMIVQHVHPGFVKDPATGRDLWFNRIKEWVGTRPDGANFDWDTVVQASLDEWEYQSAFKLQRGDFLIMDNMRVQHGRLPYRNGEGPPRTMFALHTQ